MDNNRAAHGAQFDALTNSVRKRVMKQLSESQIRYRRRKTTSICAQTGCRNKPTPDHVYCRKHLMNMSRKNIKRYRQRTGEGLCIYCGQRPKFWGVRCVICRQKWAKHPLPNGARRALRLYCEAEAKRAREQRQVEARHAIRKLLASGDLGGQYARALQLYAGIDNGKWRTYEEVGRIMKVSKQRIGKILSPSNTILAGILNGKGLESPSSSPNTQSYSDKSRRVAKILPAHYGRKTSLPPSQVKSTQA